MSFLQVENLDIHLLDANQQEPSIQTLLQNICFELEPESIVLLLGPSGSGKSLLTSLLLGFVGYDNTDIVIDRTSSSIFRLQFRKDAEEINLLEDAYPRALDGKIGIMFQSLGLLEDLTVEENIAFAYDHSRNPSQKKENFSSWLNSTAKSLGIDHLLSSYVGKLSGGQRQRVALARLLAYAPTIMIFDEPTSALDPISVRQSLELIKKAHQENHTLLSLIITHDFLEPPKIADNALVISNKTIEKIDLRPEEQDKNKDLLEKKLAEKSPIQKKKITWPRAIELQSKAHDIRWKNLSSSIRRLSEQMRYTFFSRRLYWFFRFFHRLFQKTVTWAIPFHLLAGFFLGIVITYFTFNTNFGAVALEAGEKVSINEIMMPAFFREMLQGLSLVMFGALIPLLSCIILASRSGTAVTAYLAGLKDRSTRQWDAMANFGVNPTIFFLPQVILCFSFGAWFLAYISFLAAAFGSLLISLFLNPLCTYYIWEASFWKPLGTFPWFQEMGMFSLKTISAGIATGCISFFFGTREKKSSMDTIHFLTQANIWNLLSILVIFFLILCFEFS